jgi:superoxide dismutase
MRAEKAEIMSSAQARNHETLFGEGWSWLFYDALDTVQVGPFTEPVTANSAIVRKEIFPGCLYRRYRAKLILSHLH